MNDPFDTLVITALTLLSLAAAVVGVMRLRPMDPLGKVASSRFPASPVQVVLLIGVMGGAGGLYLSRWAGTVGRWQPVAAHVDGLLLLATLLAAAILYLSTRSAMRGLYPLAVLATPLLTLILAWAVCAATWTYRPFGIDSLHPVWQAIHLAGVYLGTLGCGVAAVAGAGYLIAEHRLQLRSVAPFPVINPAPQEQAIATGKRGLPLPPLEALERVIVGGATLGFVLLTLGIAAGLVLQAEEPDALGNGWWHSPKVLLAAATWLAFAVVMTERHATLLRGSRAAWIAILGLVLLLATYGFSVASSPVAAGGAG